MDIKKLFGTQLKDSLVAVMDVMGFSSVLKKNSGIFDLILTNIAYASCVKCAKHYANILNEGKATEVARIQERIFHFQFSDTLIFVLPLKSKSIETQFVAFVDMVIWAVEKYFERGFPVQCQIEQGDCIWNPEENFLLGKPFVDAHEKAGSLDFAGIVMADDVVRMIGQKISDSDRVLRRLGIEKISVPIKGEGYQPRYCIDWRCSRYDKEFYATDIKQYLIRKFTEHGKDLSDRVVNKLNNTEYLIRQFWERAREFQEEESYYKISPQVKKIGMKRKSKSKHKVLETNETDKE